MGREDRLQQGREGGEGGREGGRERGREGGREREERRGGYHSHMNLHKIPQKYHFSFQNTILEYVVPILPP